MMIEIALQWLGTGVAWFAAAPWYIQIELTFIALIPALPAINEDI